jgi:hypothetical protein
LRLAGDRWAYVALGTRTLWLHDESTGEEHRIAEDVIDPLWALSGEEPVDRFGGARDDLLFRTVDADGIGSALWLARPDLFE